MKVLPPSDIATSLAVKSPLALLVLGVLLFHCAAFVGKMMKQMKYRQQNENETSAMCHHLLHFSVQQTLLIQLKVLKLQHYRVIDP